MIFGFKRNKMNFSDSKDASVGKHIIETARAKLTNLAKMAQCEDVSF